MLSDSLSGESTTDESLWRRLSIGNGESNFGLKESFPFVFFNSNRGDGLESGLPDCRTDWICGCSRSASITVVLWRRNPALDPVS